MSIFVLIIITLELLGTSFSPFRAAKSAMNQYYVTSNYKDHRVFETKSRKIYVILTDSMLMYVDVARLPFPLSLWWHTTYSGGFPITDPVSYNYQNITQTKGIGKVKKRRETSILYGFCSNTDTKTMVLKTRSNDSYSIERSDSGLFIIEFEGNITDWGKLEGYNTKEELIWYESNGD